MKKQRANPPANVEPPAMANTNASNTSVSSTVPVEPPDVPPVQETPPAKQPAETEPTKCEATVALPAHVATSVPDSTISLDAGKDPITVLVIFSFFSQLKYLIPRCEPSEAGPMLFAWLKSLWLTPTEYNCLVN